jgi:hypothetical protein
VLFSIFNGSLPPWTQPPNKANELIHNRILTQDPQNVRHLIAVSFPVILDPVNAKSFVQTRDHLEQIWIMWTMKCFLNSDWISTDHYSTLLDGCMLDGGADFFRLFMLHLKRQWLELCNIRDTYLTRSVS